MYTQALLTNTCGIPLWKRCQIRTALLPCKIDTSLCHTLYSTQPSPSIADQCPSFFAFLAGFLPPALLVEGLFWFYSLDAGSLRSVTPVLTLTLHYPRIYGCILPLCSLGAHAPPTALSGNKECSFIPAFPLCDGPCPAFSPLMGPLLPVLISVFPPLPPSLTCLWFSVTVTAQPPLSSQDLLHRLNQAHFSHKYTLAHSPYSACSLVTHCLSGALCLSSCF